MQNDTLYNKIMDKPLIIIAHCQVGDDETVFTLDHINYPKPKEYMTANAVMTAFLVITDKGGLAAGSLEYPFTYYLPCAVTYDSNVDNCIYVTTIDSGISLLLVGDLNDNEWVYFGDDA